MNLSKTVGSLVLIAGLTSASFGVAQTADGFDDSLLNSGEDAGVEWVVISNHFKHSENCTSRGCILMGPTVDRDACDDWAKVYNRKDPFDHARCVEAIDYVQSE